MCLKSNCQRVIFSLIVLVGFLGFISAGRAEAKWGKKKIKKIFSSERDEEQAPRVILGDPIVGEPEQSTIPGRRHVLLVSEPEQEADLTPGATLAFIEFQHIEHELPQYLQSRSVRKVSESDNGTETIRREEVEHYISRVCAKQVASAIAQHLADLNRFRVVTREHIESVLGEQYFGWSGSVNSGTAARIGELVGADYLIYGQVQLCVSSVLDYSALVGAAASQSLIPGGSGKGVLGNIAEGIRMFKPEQLRSFVLAQIQVIHAETGKRVFTTSMVGDFRSMNSAFKHDMSHRELVHRAADDLANQFIDKLLARREARYLTLYADAAWDFGRGIDLVQLGRCATAEQYFTELYSRLGSSMRELEVAKLMYNHGVALMCANRSEEALDRLWASLRLTNDPVTFEAIEFTNEILDRGRRIRVEEDPIIGDIEMRRTPLAITRPPQVDVSPSDMEIEGD